MANLSRQLRSIQGIGFPTAIMRTGGASLRHVAGYFDLSFFEVVAAEALDDIRIALRNLLAGYASVSAITSNVEIGWIDQRKSLPAVTILKISDEPIIHLTGTTEVSVARFQIDAWANSSIEAIQLSRAVFDCLQTRQGSISGGFIYKVRKIGETDLPEPPKNNSNKYIHRISTDYSIQFQIDLPTN